MKQSWRHYDWLITITNCGDIIMSAYFEIFWRTQVLLVQNVLQMALQYETEMSVFAMATFAHPMKAMQAFYSVYTMEYTFEYIFDMSPTHWHSNNLVKENAFFSRHYVTLRNISGHPPFNIYFFHYINLIMFYTIWFWKKTFFCCWNKCIYLLQCFKSACKKRKIQNIPKMNVVETT